MRPADEIENAVKKMSFKAGPKMDKDLWAETAKAQNELRKTMLAPGRRNIVRTIMRNPMTKLSGAAAVVIACLIGLSFWPGTESGIALADVLAQIEKASACRYQWSTWRTSEHGGKSIKSQAHNYTTLRSPKYGGKIEQLDPNVDPNSGMGTLTYCSIQEKAIFSIWPEQKKYSRINFDDAEQLTSLVQSQYEYYARGMVKEILRCKYESMGRSAIDGIEVEGFRTTDPNFVSQDKQHEPNQVDVKIWVDVKTRLPVRSEEHLTYDKEKKTVHFATHDYQWDIPVDATEFKPVIPDDYTLLGREAVKWPAITEEAAIQGLRQCVEFLGKYLETINLTSLYSAFEKSETPGALRLKEELRGLVGPEQDQRRMDVLKPMFVLNMFYVGLDGKDRAYYGKAVTSKDADKVLMRWKVSDGEYRVIFGDLHVETVAAERLTELEKALPK